MKRKLSAGDQQRVDRWCASIGECLRYLREGDDWEAGLAFHHAQRYSLALKNALLQQRAFEMESSVLEAKRIRRRRLAP